MSNLQDIKNGGFSISMPAIACSFPCTIHPNALHLIEMGDAWLVDNCKPIIAAWPQSKLAAKLFAADHLVNSAFGLITALLYANAVSTERIFPILKLMGWYFMLDNCVDEPSMWGADAAKSTHIIDSLMAVFVPRDHKTVSSLTLHPHDALYPTASDPHVKKPAILHENNVNSSSFSQACTVQELARGAASPSSHMARILQELAHILTRSAAEWWSDMCVDMPLSQQARFCKIFRGYLSCILKETPFRSAHSLPNMHAYLRIRLHTIGWYPLALLTEYTLCMELEQDAIANPLLVALLQAVCENIIIINDIASFRKEYERGDYFNIIMVLCFQKLQGGQRRSTSREVLDTLSCAEAAAALPSRWAEELATPELLQESMNEACEMAKMRDQQCVTLIKKIKGSRELMEKAGMGAFLEAMGNHVSGNIYWHLSSERYGICANGSNYKPAPEQIEEGMANAVAPRALLLKPAQHLTQ